MRASRRTMRSVARTGRRTHAAAYRAGGRTRTWTLVGAEAGTVVEPARSLVVGTMADLHPPAPSRGQPVEAGAQESPGHAAPGVRVLDPHRLHQTDSGTRVGPEQGVTPRRRRPDRAPRGQEPGRRVSTPSAALRPRHRYASSSD